MIDPNEDGITHINVYSKGKTPLGRFLSNFTRASFTHPEDGKFQSIEGYWYWLSTKDDRLRDLWGFQAKSFGRQLGGKDWIDDEEFKNKIKEAITIKIRTSLIISGVVSSKLPFTHYYVYGGKVVEPKEGKWILEFLNNFQF